MYYRDRFSGFPELLDTAVSMPHSFESCFFAQPLKNTDFRRDKLSFHQLIPVPNSAFLAKASIVGFGKGVFWKRGLFRKAHFLEILENLEILDIF